MTTPLFRQGERACFIGDSITHSGSFHSLVYLYHLTRFPGVQAEIWNCGRAGGVTNQAIERYDREIKPLRPTWAALMFGMNDCGRHRYGATRETPEDHVSRAAHFVEFQLRTGLLVERLLAGGCRVLLQTPTPYDQTATDRPGFPADGRVAAGLEHANDALARFAAWIREQAPRWQAEVVDYHRPFTELTLRLQKEDPGFSMTGDRIHPEPAWHLLAAYEFLVQRGMPDLVGELQIDAGSLRCRTMQRGTLLDLRREGDGIAFTWHAEALPFPLAAVYEPVLAHVPFHERLNREILAVSGLRAGQHELLIDGQPVAVFTARELAAGVNLALLASTPQARQAHQVRLLNEARHDLNMRLQDANMIDTWRPAGQSDAEALAAARAVVETAAPGNEWMTQVNRSFLDLFGQHEETREQLRAMMRDVNASQATCPRHYRLQWIASPWESCHHHPLV